VTSIGVQAAAGRARLTLTQGPISPRVLRVADSGARIGLVATQALLLGGDHVRLDIEVGPGAWLDLVETAGTVAYDADGVGSSWTVSIRVADGGVLIWAGEPFVVARGANVARATTVELGEGAVACIRETLVLGRSAETGGAIRSTMMVRHPPTVAGQPTDLLCETLDLTDPPTRSLPGLLGAARIIDTVSLLGMRAPTEPAVLTGQRFDLDGPGTLARSLTTTLAASGLATIMSGWSDAALQSLVSATTTP
jgi:urease accessory protein